MPLAQVSREDETEAEIMAEDQAKINEFARLTNRYTELKDIVKDLEVRLQSPIAPTSRRCCCGSLLPSIPPLAFRRRSVRTSRTPATR